MKKIIVVAAMAVFALGTVVGRASVSAPIAPHGVFSTASVLTHPDLPIELYTAI